MNAQMPHHNMDLQHKIMKTLKPLRPKGRRFL